MRVRATVSFADVARGAYAPGDEFELPGDVDWLAAGLVEVVDEAASAAPLPEELPGRAALEAAGWTLEDWWLATDEELLAVSGIGPATLKAMKDWYDAQPKKKVLG